MTDERADTGPEPAPPESVEPHEVYVVLGASVPPDVLELWAAYAAGNFSAAFIQAFGQRAADGAAKRVSDLARWRVRRKKGKPDEYHIGVDDGSRATIAFTADTPDEARLALLDLDVTADELRGKLLRWDRATSAWRPADDG